MFDLLIFFGFLAQRCAKLCSRAIFTDSGLETDPLKRQCAGDATESAILRFMECTGPPTVMDYRLQFPKVAEKPFSSTYKYQYSIHKNSEGRFFLVMKGAPERIIKLCRTILDSMSSPPL